NARLAQRLGGARNFLTERAPANAAFDLVLAPKDECVASALPPPEEVLCEIEPSPREKLRTGQFVAVDEVGSLPFVAYDSGVVPQGRPKLAGMLDRVAMQLLVVGEGLGRSRCHPH